MRTEIVEVSGTRIAYLATDAGSGAPAVFIHGAGGCKELWRAQIRHLDKKAFATAIDLPGHGDSGGEALDTIEGYVELVVKFLDALGIDKAIVCGHSMGGAIAQKLALTYPERAHALVLVATGARLRVAPLIFELLKSDPGKFAELYRQWGFSRNAKRATVDAAVEMLMKCPPEFIARDFAACDRFDVMDDVSKITAPALVVGAELDALTPPKYSMYLAEHIPDARLHILEDCGHTIPLEKPLVLARLIADFVESMR